MYRRANPYTPGPSTLLPTEYPFWISQIDGSTLAHDESPTPTVATVIPVPGLLDISSSHSTPVMWLGWSTGTLLPTPAIDLTLSVQFHVTNLSEVGY